MTFFADFLGDLRAPAFELDRALGAGFFPPFETGFPALRAALAAFLAVLPALPERPEADPEALLGPTAAAFPGTAPIAARMRLISRVTCSMVIMPSTVSSLRRSE